MASQGVLLARRHDPVSQLRTGLFWVLVGAVSVVGIFVLPFYFPPQIAAVSASYTVGFNNKVSVIATALISLAVTLFLWLRGAAPVERKVQQESQQAMPLQWLWLSWALAILYTGLLGWRLVRDDIFYRDAWYFITQVTHGMQDHGKLYVDFDFAYGPLLYYLPELLARVLAHGGVGVAASYMVALALMQVAGLAVVFYLLERLPLSRGVRGLVLATATVGTLTPLQGLNYTMFRFALVYAAILWISEHERPWVQALWIWVGGLVMLGISAEIFLAFAGGIALYGVYRAALGERGRLLVVLVPALSVAAFLPLTGPHYLDTAKHFAEGVTSTPIEPRIHILTLLVAALGLAPLGVAAYARRHGPAAGGIVGIYGAAVCMISSAFGHSDALHIFFSGFGLMLLSLLVVPALDGLWPRIWLALFVLVAALSNIGQATNYGDLLPKAVSRQAIDVKRLEDLTQGAKMAAPLAMPPAVEHELARTGQFVPSFYCELMDTWDAPTEEFKIAEMHRVPYVLVPRRPVELMMAPVNSRLRRLMRLGYRYQERHAPFVGGALIEQDLQRNWVPVAVFGEYELYRQR